MLLQPKEITLEDLEGKEHRYLIGKIPYMAGGREVTVDYLSSMKGGQYKRNQELASILFKNVAAFSSDGEQIILKTHALIDNHVPDIPTGIKIEAAMAEYNLGFSIAGKLREFRQGWSRSIEQWGSIISTVSRAVSQAADNAPLQNSGQSIQ